MFFEEHSDIDHYDSEQTDDEIHIEPQLQERPPSSYEAHTPVLFSPDLVSFYLNYHILNVLELGSHFAFFTIFKLLPYLTKEKSLYLIYLFVCYYTVWIGWKTFIEFVLINNLIGIMELRMRYHNK